MGVARQAASLGCTQHLNVVRGSGRSLRTFFGTSRVEDFPASGSRSEGRTSVDSETQVPKNVFLTFLN